MRAHCCRSWRKGAQKVLDALERGAQAAGELATGGLDVRTWGEEALSTLKDGLSHLSQEEAKKQAKAFEKFAEEKAHEFAEKPLHEKLGDAAETIGDGYELAARLREQPALHGCRLLAITGYGQEHDRIRSEEAGFDAHLIKPIDFRQLKQILAG